MEWGPIFCVSDISDGTQPCVYNELSEGLCFSIGNCSAITQEETAIDFQYSPIMPTMHTVSWIDFMHIGIAVVALVHGVHQQMALF